MGHGPFPISSSGTISALRLQADRPSLNHQLVQWLHDSRFRDATGMRRAPLPGLFFVSVRSAEETKQPPSGTACYEAATHYPGGGLFGARPFLVRRRGRGSGRYVLHKTGGRKTGGMFLPPCFCQKTGSARAVSQ